MSNPSFDYKQYVLANLPDDIEYDPKDGFFSHNGHKFPTFLQCKWYKDYILKQQAKLPKFTVTGAEVTNFQRDGVKYTEIYFKQSGTLSLDKALENVSWSLGAGGASSFTGWNRAGGGGGDNETKKNVLFPSGQLSITIGAGAPQNSPQGSPSRLTGSITLELLGGGAGAGGSTAAGTGANGGGGNNSMPPGVGTKHTGGTANSTRAGGGAGASRDGGAGGAAIGGNGGPGVFLDFIAYPTGVCGGGGGSSDRATLGNQGIGRDGGTDATNTGDSADAVLGGGAGGVRVLNQGNGGRGGNGFFYLVFETDKAKVDVL